MHYTIKTGISPTQTTDCLILPVWENMALTGAAQTIDQATGGILTNWIKTGDFSGKIAEIGLLYQQASLAASRILLVGCGNPKKFTPTQFQQVCATVARTLAQLDVKTCQAYLLDFPFKPAAWQLYHAILMLEQTFYRFDLFKSKKEPALKLQTVEFGILQQAADLQPTLERAQVVARAVKQTRDLGNLPANVCTPTYLAEQVTLTTQKISAIKATILERADLEKLGFNAFLAVARGSQEPPKFIVLEYHGGIPEQAPLAFVGKGITFDSGGISLKPGAGMDEMRYDMCGAASVFGVMTAAAELKLPLNLVGIMACTENMPSGAAYKPGDIVTTLSGQTIEILNTDAEGRVILSDALTYVEKFKPEIVIDVATLTGAIIISLGEKASGLFTTDDALATELLNASETSWDRAWRMPLWEEYQEQIKSPFADMANVGSEGGKSITAACLLARFTQAYRWAHIDIAGTAWTSGKTKTATGRPVPMLMEFLFNRCKT